MISASLHNHSYVDLSPAIHADVLTRYRRMTGAPDTTFTIVTDDSTADVEIAAAVDGKSCQDYCAIRRREQMTLCQEYGILWDNWVSTASTPCKQLITEFRSALDDLDMIAERSVLRVFCTTCNAWIGTRHIKGWCYSHLCFGNAQGTGEQCNSCGYFLDMGKVSSPKCISCSNTPVFRCCLEPWIFFNKSSDYAKNIKGDTHQMLIDVHLSESIIKPTLDTLQVGIEPRCLVRPGTFGAMAGPIDDRHPRVYTEFGQALAWIVTARQHVCEGQLHIWQFINRRSSFYYSVMPMLLNHILMDEKTSRFEISGKNKWIDKVQFNIHACPDIEANVCQLSPRGYKYCDLWRMFVVNSSIVDSDHFEVFCKQLESLTKLNTLLQAGPLCGLPHAIPDLIFDHIAVFHTLTDEYRTCMEEGKLQSALRQVLRLLDIAIRFHDRDEIRLVMARQRRLDRGRGIFGFFWRMVTTTAAAASDADTPDESCGHANYNSKNEIYINRRNTILNQSAGNVISDADADSNGQEVLNDQWQVITPAHVRLLHANMLYHIAILLQPFAPRISGAILNRFECRRYDITKFDLQITNIVISNG